MFHHPEKNAYLQLVCPMEPRAINKAVRYAMMKKYVVAERSQLLDIGLPLDDLVRLTSIGRLIMYLLQEQKDSDFCAIIEKDDDADDFDLPPSRKLESEQPSLAMPFVDYTVARLGFERIGLKILIRDLNSPDKLVTLQAIHTLMDQVHRPESVYFLLDHHVVYRLIDLMPNKDPVIREKVAIILTRLANFYQGKTKIMSRPIVVDHLIDLIMQDRKEIRYAASLCLKTLTRSKCACEVFMKNDKIIESLLKMIKHDHMETVLYHMNSLKNLAEWDPVPPLKANAFNVMISLLIYHNYRVSQAAMDCMAQLCKHPVGRQLADKYDVNERLYSFLISPEIQVVVSTLGLLQYTTTTEQSLWRVKQYTFDLVKRLVALAVSQSIPALQMHAMQVLVNLCDSSDIRIELKTHWEKVITNNAKIKPHEEFDGYSETSTYGLACGYNYETMCWEDVDTIKTDYGDNLQPDDVHSYINRLRAVKKNLIKAINTRKDKN